jgi:glutamate/aspartate transport system substrate-binding protein
MTFAKLTLLSVLAAALAGGATVPARAQPETAPLELTLTLAKARNTGSITLGYRESSVPFSYLSPRGEPIGYSIDLCKLLVDAMGDALGRPLAVRWRAVTPDTRIAAVRSGEIDLECGSTTNNVERQKLVAFSPTIFIAGTRLLVRKGSPIASYRDLGGRRVVVTSGTTNEKAMRDIASRLGVPMTIVSAPDHSASLAELNSSQVDAFATDDVLLYGLLAQRGLRPQYVVTGELLSYEPYGIMYRRDDPQLAQLVDDTFTRLAADGELQRRYERWFMRRLPHSEASLDLPMGGELERIFRSLAARSETQPSSPAAPAD